MKREVRLLKQKADSSLLLSVEHFNRPWDTGRTHAVLMLLDHSFEMLVKAAIIHRGGRIRQGREKNTIGLDICIRRALSDSSIRFLTREQALVLQTINGLRDASQHYLVDLSEQQLHLHAQSGLTLFGDILNEVFGDPISTVLPARMLPISTVAIREPLLLFRDELDEVKALLAPGSRRSAEAHSRLRSLAVVDGALSGEFVQPSEGDLRRIGERIRGGETLDDIFPGICGVEYRVDGTGVQLSLRISRKKGVPVSLVPEGTPGAGVVAVKRVDEGGFYNLSHRDLSRHVGLTTSKTTAAIQVLDLKTDPECFKEFTFGKTRHPRYSQKAIGRIKELLTRMTAEQIWAEYRGRLSPRGTSRIQD